MSASLEFGQTCPKCGDYAPLSYWTVRYVPARWWGRRESLRFECHRCRARFHRPTDDQLDTPRLIRPATQPEPAP